MVVAHSCDFVAPGIWGARHFCAKFCYRSVHLYSVLNGGMVSRRTKIAASLFMLFAGTVAGLLLIEMFLRFRPPEWLKMRMTALNLRKNAEEFGSDAGWSVERIDGKFAQFTPNTQFHISGMEFDYDAHIDELGGRVVRGSRNKKTPVIPFFGDSFMFGIGVKDDETFVSLLNEQSQDRYVNLGVPGSALPQHLDILELRSHELHSPRICVFSFFTGNDFTDIVKYYTEGSRTQGSRDLPEQSWMLRALNSAILRLHFLGKSYLVGYCKQLLINRRLSPHENRRNEKAWAIHLPGGGHLSKEPVVLMEKRQLFRKQAESYLEKSLTRLVRLSKEDDFTPFFVIIPDKIQIDPDLLATKINGSGLTPADFDPPLPDIIVADELKKFGIRYFDLFDALNGQKGQYYKFDDHFTPAGCRTAAKNLAAPLAEFIRSVNHQ
jgi:hypothetical protein